MSARVGRIALAVVITLGPLMSGQARAQAVATSFEDLRAALAAPTTIVVTMSDGTRVKGVVSLVNSSQVLLRSGERMLTVERRDVKRIQTERRDSLLNGVLIGAAAGALLGLIPDYYDDCEECHDSLYVSLAFGAGIGLLVDALRPARRLVYEAPSGPSVGLDLAAGRSSVGVRATVRWR